MSWLESGLFFLVLLFFFTFVFYYKKRHKKLLEKMEYMYRLFDTHFKVTDQTILDTRHERDFWKARALKAEKK